MNRSRWIAESAILVALAMIFSYIEALIPFSFGVPGIKLGLANLVVVATLYFLPPYQVFTILVLRIVLISFLFGNMSAMLYSLAGGFLSCLIMLALKKSKLFSMVGVSIAGGVAHNVGQLFVAAVVVQSGYVLTYLPFLMVAGVCAGLLIGLIGKKLAPLIKKYQNTLDI